MTTFKLSEKKIGSMKNFAFKSMNNAYAPYSNYKVGACVLSSKNNFYTGCNVESVTFTNTTHAEMNAIDTMVANGEREIKAILIFTNDKSLPFPCALCRQKIAEFSKNAIIFSCNRKDKIRKITIKKLYPEAFVKI